MIITEHAARRFVQRLSPSTFLPDARALLRRASRSAVRLPDRTYKGQQIWRTTDDEAAGALLVVKHDAAVGLVVVTVLAAVGEGEGDGGEDEVRAAFERASVAKEDQRRIVEAERAAGMAPPPPPVVTYNARLAIDAREAKRAAKKAGRERAKAERAAGVARRAAKRIAHEATMKRQEEEAKARRTMANAARRRDDHAEHCAQWAGVLP